MINSRQWNCLIGIAGHSNSDKVAIAYNAVGGIKFDPSRPRQINLAPGMGGAAAKPSRAISAGNINVPGHKTGSKSHGPRRLHHEKRKITAAALSQPNVSTGVWVPGHFCVDKKSRLQ